MTNVYLILLGGYRSSLNHCPHLGFIQLVGKVNQSFSGGRNNGNVWEFSVFFSHIVFLSELITFWYELSLLTVNVLLNSCLQELEWRVGGVMGLIWFSLGCTVFFLVMLYFTGPLLLNNCLTDRKYVVFSV